MSLCYGAVFVDDVTQCPDHGYREVILPDVPSQIHPYGTPLHAIVHKLEYLKL